LRTTGAPRTVVTSSGACVLLPSLGEASVAQLMEPFDLSQPTISKHLKVLEHAGLGITRSFGVDD
jgi:DNA-binding transcriptional ArsR family regulator